MIKNCALYEKKILAFYIVRFSGKNGKCNVFTRHFNFLWPYYLFIYNFSKKYFKQNAVFIQLKILQTNVSVIFEVRAPLDFTQQIKYPFEIIRLKDLCSLYLCTAFRSRSKHLIVGLQ